MKFLFVGLVLFGAFARAEDCGRILSSSSSATDDYLAYLEALRGEGLISAAELAGLISSPMKNPITVSSSAAHLHARELDEYLRTGGLSAVGIQAWAMSQLRALQERDVERTKAVRKTSSVNKPEMLKIKGATFRRAVWTSPVTKDGPGDFELRETTVGDFEMMPTTVKREMFQQLTRTRPQSFGIDCDDCPVVMISFLEVAIYANQVSREVGLPEYYAINEARKFSPDGLDRNGERMPDSIRELGGPGYRVPTAAEYDFVITRGGASGDGRSPEVDSHNFNEYAWTSINFDDVLPTVAQLKPLTFQGGQFFDLLGGVSEWTDPDHYTGGNFNEEPRFIYRHRTNKQIKQHFEVGFRLARSLNPR